MKLLLFIVSFKSHVDITRECKTKQNKTKLKQTKTKTPKTNKRKTKAQLWFKGNHSVNFSGHHIFLERKYKAGHTLMISDSFKHA